MANGEFLRGISRGVFGEQARQQELQLGKDEKRKGQIIDLLSNLAPQVEPGSLPLLMGHLGDVIGIKGKMRKFWDVFSGQPDLTPEAQMGDLMRNVSNQLAGPDEARMSRGKSTLGSLSGLFGGGMKPYEDPMKDRIVFRDPRREKIEETERILGKKFEQKESEIAVREENIRERQRQQDQRKIELKDHEADLRAEQDIRERAILYARGQGRAYLSPSDWSLATKDISRLTGLNEDYLNAKIAGARAQAERDEAIARGGGIAPGELRRLGIAERGEKRGVSTALGGAVSDEQRATEDMRGAAAAINDAIKLYGGAVLFDEATGKFIPRDSSAAGQYAIQGIEGLPNIIQLREKYTEAKGRLEKAKSLKGTFEGQQKELQKVTPPPAATPKSRGNVGRVGMGTTRKIGEYIKKDVPNPDTYPLGKIVVDPNTKKRFSIERKVGNTLYLLPVNE